MSTQGRGESLPACVRYRCLLGGCDGVEESLNRSWYGCAACLGRGMRIGKLGVRVIYLLEAQRGNARKKTKRDNYDESTGMLE